MISSRTLNNIKKDFFFKKKVVLYMYIYFFYFQLFVVKWTDDEYIFFEPFTYLDTSSPGTFWACPGTFRACLRAPTKQHPKNLQKYHAIFEKKKKLNKKSSRYTKFDKKKTTNKKSQQQQEQTFSRLIIIPPQSNWQLISWKKNFFSWNWNFCLHYQNQ